MSTLSIRNASKKGRPGKGDRHCSSLSLANPLARIGSKTDQSTTSFSAFSGSPN